MSGPWGCAAGPEILRWLLLDTADAPLRESKGEVIGARVLHLLCLWGSFCPAGVLVEKEPHPSVPLFLGAEALQCRRGQWAGERC